MALTKKQFARYRVINDCLQYKLHVPSTSDDSQYGGYWPVVDLIDKIREKLDEDVSERQIKEDLFRMKEDPDLAHYAPIKNKKGIGYYYETDYDFNERPLSSAEINALKDVTELLHQFKGFKYFEGVEGLIYNIEEKVNASEFQDVQFDILPGYIGLDYIDSIKKAIKEKKVLKMTYKAFYEEAETPRHIHPYLLKEYNNRWFVFTYTNEYKGEGVYGLDRIKLLETTTKKYRKPNTKKIKDYFKDIIGVTNYEEQEVQDIVIQMKVDRANYLRTKPIHKSQDVEKESNEYVWFSFKLKPNPELKSLILSYGKDAVVEQPESLANEIKGLLEEAVNNYQ